MRDLNYDLKQLCRHNRDGSYATQADREHILDLIADQLHEMGFRHMNAQSLKPKHVEKLVERWLAEELSPGTIKNRMSALRWWAEKIGKENIIARTNAAYGIPDRVYVTNISKAKELDMDQLKQIPRSLHPHVALPAGTVWPAPGGVDQDRPGSGPIGAIDWCSRLPGPRAGGNARFPSAPRSSDNSSTRRRRSPKARVWWRPRYNTYRDYLKHFRSECERVGIHGFHGHRHFYAQMRYQELTGWECPARGGTESKQLTPKQKEHRSPGAGDRSAARWVTAASRLPRCTSECGQQAMLFERLAVHRNVGRR